MSETEKKQSESNIKNIAILSYVTFIGWIIAYTMRGKIKSEVADFHLRQGLGIILTFVFVYIVSFVSAFVLPSFLSNIIGYLSYAVWILAILGIFKL